MLALNSNVNKLHNFLQATFTNYKIEMITEETEFAMKLNQDLISNWISISTNYKCIDYKLNDHSILKAIPLAHSWKTLSNYKRLETSQCHHVIVISEDGWQKYEGLWLKANR